MLNDTKNAQTILLSNSKNKGTAVEVGFKGDGRITIKSNGPVTVLSPDITLEAGDKGSIKLHGKNITLDADENLHLLSGVKTEANTQEMAVYATQALSLEGSTLATLTGGQVIVTGDATTSIKAPVVNIN